MTRALLLLALLPAQAMARPVVLSHYHLPGQRTASGRLYSTTRPELATRAYPLGTRLRVTLNGRSVVATVTDRPARRYGHRLDLNEAARRRLGFRGLATGRVSVVARAPPGR